MNLKRYLSKLIKIDFIKSFYVNYSQFGFQGILKWPIILEYAVKYRNKGEINIEEMSFYMLSINSKSSIEISKGGKLVLKGANSCFNSGSNIIIGKDAVMEIGHRFYCNGRSDFNCLKHVVFGNDVLFSVNIMLMDTDFHKIYNNRDEQINSNQEIIIGDKVWIGCNTTVLKGTRIGNNIIIGACSLLSGKYLCENSIYVGNPSKIILSDITWHY